MYFDIYKYNSNDFNATYSPEDNKLRLYADVRIDDTDWKIMKNNGWRWAPKQELFYSYWSVANEDFVLALAGDILPEEMTMVERAEAKAQRLLILAEKRATQCIGYQKAANDLKNRLDNNQPILLGHHSQAKSEKITKQVDRAIGKAKETGQAVGYWVWRAQGVVGHADHKNSPGTIANRIKTLSKELRDNQRELNEAAKKINLINQVKNLSNQELKKRYTITLCGDWKVSKLELNKKIESEELSLDQALTELTCVYNNLITSEHRSRVINHILNRLAYEQNQLAIVPFYEGEITPAVIQTFLRSQGADKPKASKSDYGWLAVSDVCLPLHIAPSNELELDDQEWRELMQSIGYEVPTKRTVSAKAPLLNFKMDSLTGKLHRRIRTLAQVTMTMDEYKRNGKDHSFTLLSACGNFRFRAGYVKVGIDKWGHGDFDYRAVFISDKKAHDVPESIANTMIEEA